MKHLVVSIHPCFIGVEATLSDNYGLQLLVLDFAYWGDSTGIDRVLAAATKLEIIAKYFESFVAVQEHKAISYLSASWDTEPWSSQKRYLEELIIATARVEELDRESLRRMTEEDENLW